MELHINKFESGQLIVEVLVAFGLASILIPAIILGFISGTGGRVQQEQRLKATGYLREAEEAVRSVRSADWSNITTNGTYHPVAGALSWSLQSGSETVGTDFTRSIVISDLTPPDPSKKLVTVNVSWNNILPSNLSSSFYLARLKNLTWLQTTFDEFNNIKATLTGTTVTNTAGGEVVLASGGVARSDWCAPTLTLAQLDLPKNGVANAVSAAVGESGAPDQIIAGTGDNASGVSLGYVTVTDTNPPVPTMPGTFDGFKTNAVFVAGRFAYIATDTNFKEVVAIDLNNKNGSTGKYAEAGYFDAPGNGDGNGVTVAGAIGFMTDGNKLYSFDVSKLPDDTKTMAQLGTVTLAGTGARLVISGNFVFISESSGNRPLEIVQFSPDGKTLNVVAWSSISGQNGVDVVVNSTATRGYLATGQGKVYIINTSSPYSGALPAPVGVFDTNGMTPKGVAVVTNNKAIVVGIGGSLQYQVIDITNEGSPSLCTEGGNTSGGLSIPTGVNGISSIQEADGDTYSYIITGDSTSELKIIQGGSGGGGGVYTNDGIYESVPFDAGHSVMFNRFDVTMATPTDTTLQYRVAVTNPVAGSCDGASYTFIGPDKTTGTYFSGSSALPVGDAAGYSNPGQCLKFRAYMHTSNTNNSPVLYDVTFNFSP